MAKSKAFETLLLFSPNPTLKPALTPVYHRVTQRHTEHCLSVTSQSLQQRCSRYTTRSSPRPVLCTKPSPCSLVGQATPKLDGHMLQHQICGRHNTRLVCLLVWYLDHGWTGKFWSSCWPFKRETVLRLKRYEIRARVCNAA